MGQKLNLNKSSINAVMDAISSNEKEFEEFIKAELTEISKIKVSEDEKISEDEKKCRKLKAKSFIEFAEQDFTSAKILYKSGVYSTAIYHLQQTVEKFVKAYMLMFFKFNKKEIYYIGHDTPKAFLKLLDKFKKILEPILSFNKKAHILNTRIAKVSDQDIREFEGLIKKSENKEQIAKMGSKDVKKLITLAEKLMNLSYKLIDALKDHKNQEIIITEVKKSFVDIASDKDQWKNSEVDTSVDKMIKNINIEYFKIPTLYILSTITYPHATLARYPNKTFLCDNYDKNLGIVKYFDKIVNLLDKLVAPYIKEFRSK